MKNLLPIRKLIAGALAAGIVALARHWGVSIGDGDADQLVNEFIGFVVAYLIPDPRVQRLERRVGLAAKLRALNLIVTQATATPATPTYATTSTPTSTPTVTYVTSPTPEAPDDPSLP